MQHPGPGIEFGGTQLQAPGWSSDPSKPVALELGVRFAMWVSSFLPSYGANEENSQAKLSLAGEQHCSTWCSSLAVYLAFAELLLVSQALCYIS